MVRNVIRNITFDLSREGLDKAIREVNEVRNQLNTAMTLLIRKLAEEEGVATAKAYVADMGAIDTGELESSIYGFYHPQSRIGYVRTDCLHAVFVEYGTGIIGKAMPHPEAGIAGWKYDVHGHGVAGWVYSKEPDDTFHWTLGYESRPFMYKTLRWLEGAAERLGPEILIREMGRGG